LAKIFKYELKRLLLSKLFIALIFVNALFAWYVLNADTIIGVAFTAPFSVWSFGAYLAGVMPMFIMTTMFMLSFYFSNKEEQVAVLTSATPVDALKYMLVRGAVVVLCFLLLCLIAIAMSVYFYITYFDYWNFAVFIVPAIVTVIPGFVFLLGVGYWLARVRSWLLYMFIPVSFILSFAALPGAFDFFGGGFYRHFPLTLPVEVNGEPAFVYSTMFLMTRVLYLIVGSILLFAGGICQQSVLHKCFYQKRVNLNF